MTSYYVFPGSYERNLKLTLVVQSRDVHGGATATAMEVAAAVSFQPRWKSLVQRNFAGYNRYLKRWTHTQWSLKSFSDRSDRLQLSFIGSISLRFDFVGNIFSFVLLVFPHGHVLMPCRGHGPHSSLWHIRLHWWIWQFNNRSHG
jgi:hypothetical protein